MAYTRGVGDWTDTLVNLGKTGAVVAASTYGTPAAGAALATGFQMADQGSSSGGDASGFQKMFAQNAMGSGVMGGIAGQQLIAQRVADAAARDVGGGSRWANVDPWRKLVIVQDQYRLEHGTTNLPGDLDSYPAFRQVIIQRYDAAQAEAAPRVIAVAPQPVVNSWTTFRPAPVVKSNKGMYIGIGIAATALIGIGAFVMMSRKSQV